MRRGELVCRRLALICSLAPSRSFVGPASSVGRNAESTDAPLSDAVSYAVSRSVTTLLRLLVLVVVARSKCAHALCVSALMSAAEKAWYSRIVATEGGAATREPVCERAEAEAVVDVLRFLTGAGSGYGGGSSALLGRCFLDLIELGEGGSSSGAGRAREETLAELGKAWVSGAVRELELILLVPCPPGDSTWSQAYLLRANTGDESA